MDRKKYYHQMGMTDEPSISDTSGEDVSTTEPTDLSTTNVALQKPEYGYWDPIKGRVIWKSENEVEEAKDDAGKPRLTLVPRKIIFDIAKVREYGNAKYPEGGKDNWKKVSPERYRDAAFRHFMAYLDDPEGVDSESGLPHLWHLACNIAFLCEMDGHC